MEGSTWHSLRLHGLLVVARVDDAWFSLVRRLTLLLASQLLERALDLLVVSLAVGNSIDAAHLVYLSHTLLLI